MYNYEIRKIFMSDEEHEKHVQAGLDASQTKGKAVEIEAGGIAVANRQAGEYFPRLKRMAEQIGEGEEFDFKSIREHFMSEVDWYKKKGFKEDGTEKGTLRRQIYAATVNDPLRLDYQKKPRGYDENLDIFFAVDGDRSRLVRHVPEKSGNWRIEKFKGGKNGVRIKQSEDDPVQFKIVGDVETDVEETFEQVMRNMESHKAHMQANYLPVIIRYLLKNYPNHCAWEDIAKEVEKLNVFYDDIKGTRADIAREMACEQQNRKNFVGIICEDKDGNVAKTKAQVTTCYLDIGTLDEPNDQDHYLLTDEQQQKINEFCGRSIAEWHVKEMRR